MSSVFWNTYKNGIIRRPDLIKKKKKSWFLPILEPGMRMESTFVSGVYHSDEFYCFQVY